MACKSSNGVRFACERSAGLSAKPSESLFRLTHPENIGRRATQAGRMARRSVIRGREGWLIGCGTLHSTAMTTGLPADPRAGDIREPSAGS